MEAQYRRNKFTMPLWREKKEYTSVCAFFEKVFALSDITKKFFSGQDQGRKYALECADVTSKDDEVGWQLVSRRNKVSVLMEKTVKMARQCYNDAEKRKREGIVCKG